MSASFAQRSLRIIAVFETYNSDLPLEKWIRVVREPEAKPPEVIDLAAAVVREEEKPRGEEAPVLEDLFLEAERRRFPFYGELGEISMKDLAQQCAEIARQMRSRGRGAL